MEKICIRKFKGQWYLGKKEDRFCNFNIDIINALNFFLQLFSSSFWSVFLFLFYWFYVVYIFWTCDCRRKGFINLCLPVRVCVRPSETSVAWNRLSSFFKKFDTIILIQNLKKKLVMIEVRRKFCFAPKMGKMGQKNFFCIFWKMPPLVFPGDNLKWKITLLSRLLPLDYFYLKN